MTALRRSFIDDVRLFEDSRKGEPIRFCNQEFRRMFDLAELTKDDVFLDLGSGWGQSLIVAVTEYGVKMAIGIESDLDRLELSKRRIKKRKIEERVRIIFEDFDRVLQGKSKLASLNDVSVIFYGLSSDPHLTEEVQKFARRGCKLLYYFNGIFPEILAEKEDFPFYLSVVPFKRPKSEYEWLASIVRKKTSSLVPGKRPSVKELWEELTHDLDVYGDGASDVRDYKIRLKGIIKE